MSGIPQGTIIPTIDVALVVVRAKDAQNVEISYAIKTANNLQPETQIETTDGVKLIIKGWLLAQKLGDSVITGTKLTLTDNVFRPEVVKILQGGEIVYDAETPTKVIGYRPPVSGSGDKGQTFECDCYSAQYSPAGKIVQYEKITYPNCVGTPLNLTSQDDTFRSTEIVINSAPDQGEPPYEIAWVTTLPEVESVEL